MTTLAVTRHPVFTWLAVTLRVLLIRHEAVLLLRIDRTIEMACARVVAGAATEFTNAFITSNATTAILKIKRFIVTSFNLLFRILCLVLLVRLLFVDTVLSCFVSTLPGLPKSQTSNQLPSSRAVDCCFPTPCAASTTAVCAGYRYSVWLKCSFIVTSISVSAGNSFD